MGADRLRPATRRSDQEDDRRLAGRAATLEQGSEERCIEALDQREVRHLAVEACEEAVVLKGGRVVGAALADELVGEAGRARYRDLIT